MMWNVNVQTWVTLLVMKHVIMQARRLTLYYNTFENLWHFQLIDSISEQ